MLFNVYFKKDSGKAARNCKLGNVSVEKAGSIYNCNSFLKHYMLAQLLKERLPDLKYDIQVKINETEDRLQKLPRKMTNDVEKRVYIFDVIY